MIGTLAVGQVTGFAASPNTGSETGGAYVTISAASTVSSGTISYTVISPTTMQAEGDSYPDYTMQVPGTISMTGRSSYDLNIEIVNDSYYEADETITLLLYNPTGDVTLDTGNDDITVTISDNDDPPTLYFVT